MSGARSRGDAGRLCSITVAGAWVLFSLASSSNAAAQSTRPNYSAADVKFMRAMISHHAQALAMTALVPGRTTREDIRLLAERIEVSQNDEIALMKRWLADRHEAMSHMHVSGMPGMLTAEQLTQLANRKGAEFDRLFLEDMIRHHEGALVMVAALLGISGAAQEPEIFRFTSDIDADQRAEIKRMRALLPTPSGATPRR